MLIKMLMLVEVEMWLFDEAAKKISWQRKGSLLFFFICCSVCGDGTDSLKVGGLITLRRHAESEWFITGDSHRIYTLRLKKDSPSGRGCMIRHPQLYQTKYQKCCILHKNSWHLLICADTYGSMFWKRCYLGAPPRLFYGPSNAGLAHVIKGEGDSDGASETQ